MATQRTVQLDAHIDNRGREGCSFPSCSKHVNLVDGNLMGPGLASRAVTLFPLSPLYLFAKPVEIQHQSIGMDCTKNSIQILTLVYLESLNPTSMIRAIAWFAASSGFGKSLVLFLMMNASLGSRSVPQFLPIKLILLLRVF